MSGWHTCVLEFGSMGARDDLLGWFEANHPVEFPDDNSVTDTYAPLTLDGFDYIADFALVGNYVYITCREDFEDAVDATSEHWRRAAYAEFDATTETCTKASFYAAESDEPEDPDEYEGVNGAGGVDILFRLTMEHQFRFRSYAAALPKTPDTFLPGAYDAVEPTEDRVGTIKALAGCETTEDGLSFLNDDFNQTRMFAKQMGLDSNTLEEDDEEESDQPESNEPDDRPEQEIDESGADVDADDDESDSVDSESETKPEPESDQSEPSGADEDDSQPESDDEPQEGTDEQDETSVSPESEGNGDESEPEPQEVDNDDDDDNDSEPDEEDDDEDSPPVDHEDLEEKTDGIAEFITQRYEEGEGADEFEDDHDE